VASPTAAAGHADSRYRETLGFFSNRGGTLASLEVVGSAETEADAASAMRRCCRCFALPLDLRHTRSGPLGGANGRSVRWQNRLPHGRGSATY
jgi:hypothetical protein